MMAPGGGADPQLACEHATVALSLENLRAYPWVAERLAEGSLKLHGAHFDIRTGTLNLLRQDGSFSPA